jgi:autotransporter-associated beta strand protein
MISHTRNLAVTAFMALTAFRAAGQVPNGAWVYPSATGNLLYQLDERGQRIIDFSQCGYRGGTEPLPNVTALIPQNRWVLVSPGTGDDTALIQAAIDSVEALTPDANGWRGVVFLNAGEYQLATTLTINASGVVLKGAGTSATLGTRLRATDARQYTLIAVSGAGSRSTVTGTTHNLTPKSAPAGTRTFEVDSTSGLAVGHTVIVKRPSTANWIADMDMDQLGPAPVVPWTAGSKDLLFDRTITRIDGNWITVDVPLPQTFEALYGGGQIWRYTWTGRIQQVGIEDIYGFSDYASATDELHGWKFIQINNAMHSWVRSITAQYFGYAAVNVGDGAKWLTVADSQCLDPISIIDGGRRYSFNNDGAECALFVNNYARKGRHDFVFGEGVPGPNAFVHGTADTVYSDTGPHHRWSVGGLFDLVTVNGNEINVQNRGNYGTGHGWAGAYMAVWNCTASGFRVRNPPTARNWLVGSIGTIRASAAPVGADPAGTYDSSGPTGTGKAVHPRSLYYGQLQQRMKWPGSEFREVWLGDVDQHTSTGGTGETVNCDAAWLAQVAALGAPPAAAKFDELAGNRYIACTLDFPLDPGDTIVAASLTVSLRGIGNAATDSVWLDSTTNPQTFASLGWTPVSLTAPTVRTVEVAPALLADGRLNFACGPNSAVDFLTLHLQVQKAQPSVSTITLHPVADAYVQGGANANTNFGISTSLITKEDSNVDLERETFLRWDLSGISGKIVQARVRLAGTTTAQAGNESCATLVSSDAWTETTLTFANKPAAGKLFAQWLPAAGQAVEFSVTPEVTDTLLGDGMLSLRILSTADHGANGSVSYASRENPTAANRPQLILTIENPPTAAVKAATGSMLNNGPAWASAFVPVDPDTATWDATSLTGAMTLGADQRWAGLIVSNPAAALILNGPQSLTLGSAGIDMAASTANLTLNHPVVLGENQTWNVGAGRTLAATGPVSGPRSLTKSGTGNLTFSGTATYTGTTTIDQGTLAFTTTRALNGGLLFGTAATNTTAGLLDLTAASTSFAGSMIVNTNSATASEIRIGTAQTLTINNNVQIGAATPGITGTVTSLNLTGGGVFNVATAAAGSFNVGASTSTTASQAATLNLTALKAAIINTSATGTFRVGTNTGTNIGGQGQMFLPAPGVADTLATTTITAGTISIGYNGSNVAPVWKNKLTLGTGLTTLNADTINIGTGGRDLGEIVFGQASGDIIIRAATGGTTRATAINVGSGGGGTASVGSPILMDFSGHDADILVTSLNVGNQNRAGTQAYEFNFGTGNASLASKLDATNVNIGFRGTSATTTTTLTSKVNLSGGTIILGNAGATGTGVNIGSSSYILAGTASTVGELNISGGNVTIYHSTSLGAAVRLGTNQVTGNGTVTASLNLTGGTTTLGGDIIRNITSPRTTSTVKISGGNLDMGGHDIGSATEPITLTAESGTLQNIATINGTGGLIKTTTGTLALSGTHTYPGVTTVSSGTLALSGTLAGALTVNNGTLAPRGLPATANALTLNAGGTFQARINGTTAGAQYDQLAVAGSVTLGGLLDLVAGPGLAAGTSFRVLHKTSAGAISGIFTGKPEGSVFNEDGYTWIISYLGGGGNDVTLTLPTPLQSWRLAHFGTLADTGNAADLADPNNDGEINLLEYATAQNPTAATPAAFTAIRSVSDMEITYTRSKAALTGGVIFAVEWSDTLAPNSWSTSGVTQTILTDNGTQQTIKATIPTAPTIPRRFTRLKVTSPPA